MRDAVAGSETVRVFGPRFPRPSVVDPLIVHEQRTGCWDAYQDIIAAPGAVVIVCADFGDVDAAMRVVKIRPPKRSSIYEFLHYRGIGKGHAPIALWSR